MDVSTAFAFAIYAFTGLVLFIVFVGILVAAYMVLGDD
jgi:hypothetical protein